MLIGILTASFPYFTLKYVYGYDPIFRDPDPTWSSYKYGYLNVFSIASSVAQIFIASMFFVLLLEQFGLYILFSSPLESYLIYVFTPEIL